MLTLAHTEEEYSRFRPGGRQRLGRRAFVLGRADAPLYGELKGGVARWMREVRDALGDEAERDPMLRAWPAP